MWDTIASESCTYIPPYIPPHTCAHIGDHLPPPEALPSRPCCSDRQEECGVRALRWGGVHRPYQRHVQCAHQPQATRASDKAWGRCELWVEVHCRWEGAHGGMSSGTAPCVCTAIQLCNIARASQMVGSCYLGYRHVSMYTKPVCILGNNGSCTYVYSGFRGVLVPIAHCNWSHDCSIRMTDYHMLAMYTYIIGIHMRLHYPIL